MVGNNLKLYEMVGNGENCKKVNKWPELEGHGKKLQENVKNMRMARMG